MILLPLLAGAISIFSPCVLPLLPVFAASCAQKKPKSILFLIVGFLAAFAVLQGGLILVRSFLFVDMEWLRRVGAFLMIVMGGFMLFPPDTALSRLVGMGARLINFASPTASGNFIEGLSLGLIWSPCIGPVLGATLGLLATQGSRGIGLFQILLFGLGTAFPLMVLGLGFEKLGRFFTPQNKQTLRWLHSFGAVTFIFLGIAVLFKWDKGLESWVTLRLPDWWSEILSSY